MALVAIRQQNNSAQISLQAIADFPCVPNFFNFVKGLTFTKIS